MRIGVFWFGRTSRSPYETQVGEYRKRVLRRWPAVDIALKPAADLRRGDPAAALAREAEVVFSKIPAGWRIVLLDEHGPARTSVDFASRLRTAEENGSPGVAFVIGSDLGTAPALKSRANETMSLGPMTLPHLLARLILWEQLYRATDILGHGNYHRSG